MNIKNLAMWAVIVILTIGLYNMFKNPQRAANQNNTIITKLNNAFQFTVIRDQNVNNGLFFHDLLL